MRSSLPSVRQTVAALRSALLAHSCEEIDASMAPLQQAAATLDHLRMEATDREPQSDRERQSDPDSGSDKDFRGELESLSRELRAAGRLIAQGLAFNLGMARLLAPAAAGYRRNGEPAPLKPSGTLLVRG